MSLRSPALPHIIILFPIILLDQLQQEYDILHKCPAKQFFLCKLISPPSDSYQVASCLNKAKLNCGFNTVCFSPKFKENEQLFTLLSSAYFLVCLCLLKSLTDISEPEAR